MGYGGAPGEKDEEGGVVGLWLEIDTNNLSGAPGVFLHYNGQIVDSHPESLGQMVRSGEHDISLSVTDNGFVTYSHPAIGTQTYQLSSWNPHSDWQFAVYARNGSYFSEYRVATFTVIDHTNTPFITLSGSIGVEAVTEAQGFAWSTENDFPVGVEVTVTRDDQVVYQSSDANGLFRFDDFGYGDFQITVTATDTEYGRVVTATRSVTVTNQYIGRTVKLQFDVYVGDVAAVGTKYLDVNGDGVRQADGADGVLGTMDDEIGIEGWTIFSDDNVNGQWDEGEPRTLTDANGQYSLDNLATGEHVIRETAGSSVGWDAIGPSRDVVDGLTLGVDFGDVRVVDVRVAGEKAYRVDEGNNGQPVTIIAALDPNLSGTGEFNYSWQVARENGFVVFSKGGQVPSGASTLTYPFIPFDNGQFIVTLTITDSAGRHYSDAAYVFVSNLDPTAALTIPPIREGDDAVLDASGSRDPAGVLDPLTYTFDIDVDGDGKFAGAELGVVSGTMAKPRLSWAELNALGITDGTGQSYDVRVTVSDGDGGQATALASLTVNNAAPTVDIGGPYTIHAGVGSVTFDASGSNDASPDDKAALTYAWDIDLNRDGVYSMDEMGLATEASATFTWEQLTDLGIDDQPKSWSVRLRVSDGEEEASAKTTLEVVNQAPIASAGGPYTIHEGESLTLDGSQSYDADGQLLTFMWDINGNGETDAVGEFATLTWAQLVALGITDGPQTQAIRLHVDDGFGGNDSSAAATLTVENAPPTAVFNVPASAFVGESVSVSFDDATDPSPDDIAAGLLYSLDLNNDGDFTDVFDVLDSPTGDLTVTFPSSGTYTIRGRVRDQDGGYTDYTREVVVASHNHAPAGTDKTVTTLVNTAYVFTVADFGFNDPNDELQNGFVGVVITTLPAAGSLADNGVAVGAGQFVSVGDIEAGRLRFTPATNHAAGDYQRFTFQVQDDGGTALDGQDLDPSPNTITVEVAAPDKAPILAPIGDRRVTEFKTLQIAVSFTDPNDDNVLLSVSGLPSGASFDPQTGILIWTPNGGQAGVYTLTFMATDEGLLSDSEQITVTVDDAPNTNTIIGRHLFYNQSKFDGNDPGAGDGDDAAVATDKIAYKAGDGLIGPSAMSSYAFGINGIMVDVQGDASGFTADDFSFKVGDHQRPVHLEQRSGAERRGRAARQGREMDRIASKSSGTSSPSRTSISR